MPTIDDFQNNLNRRPLVELIASNFQDEIPFDGSLLTTNDEDEFHPSTLMHSGGRLMVVFAKQPANVSWETSYNLSNIVGVSMDEMSDGNVLVLWMEWKSGTYYIERRIITETGTLVSSGNVTSFADTEGDASGITTLRIR
ncbi:MAG: hypothetical protein ACW980_25560 [Promethearchaeota archaeon]|jgi:hypothetical protein